MRRRSLLSFSPQPAKPPSNDKARHQSGIEPALILSCASFVIALMALVLVVRMPEHTNVTQTLLAPLPSETTNSEPCVPTQEFYGARFLPKIGSNIYSSENDASETVASVFYGDVVVYGSVITGSLVSPPALSVPNVTESESWPVQHRDTYNETLQTGTCASGLLYPGAVLDAKCVQCSVQQFLQQREKCCVSPDKCQTSTDPSCYRMPTKEACMQAGCVHIEQSQTHTIDNASFQTHCLPSTGPFWESNFYRDDSPALEAYRQKQDVIYKTLPTDYRNAMDRPSYYLPEPLVLPSIEYALFGSQGHPLVATPQGSDPWVFLSVYLTPAPIVSIN
jgi:hypothetical protein